MVARTYDRTAILRRAGVVENEAGDLVPGWSNLATVPAKKLLGRAVERIENAENAATSVMTIRVPWSNEYADLNPRDRATVDGLDADIKSVIEIERRIEFEIICETRTDTA